MDGKGVKTMIFSFIRKYAAIIMVSVVLLALTIIGSFWDYEISKTLYFGELPSENFFGVALAFVGVIPTFVGWAFLGASIIYLSRKQCQSKKKRGWLMALSVLLFVLAFFYFCNTLFLVNESAFSVHWAIAYSVGVVILALGAFLGYWMSKNSDNPHLLERVLFLTAISLVTMVIIISTKEIMDRPRFRWVMETGRLEYFRNWWQSGNSLKVSQGVSAVKNAFASFPSGHSAYAMFAVFIFPALAEYKVKWKKYRAGLCVGGFIWWALIAFSRLTVGAHYLTDVSIAAMVTIFAYVVIALLFYFLKKKKVQ